MRILNKKMIDGYNGGKMFVDISDQIYFYSPFIRKTSKWWIRLLFHIITQMMIINGWTLPKTSWRYYAQYVQKEGICIFTKPNLSHYTTSQASDGKNQNIQGIKETLPRLL